MTLKDAVAVVNRICTALPSTSDEPAVTSEEPVDNHGYDFWTNGLMCMQGTDNVLQDFGKALTCFERAISLGNKEAYIGLSEIYLWGLGVRRNPRQAIDLLNDGAKAGNPECLYHLWYIYSGTARNLYGDHSERCPDEINTGNAETVFKWYLDAMEKSSQIVERTRLYSYMEWACSLPNNVRGKIPGRHSGALLDALVRNIRSQIVQIRLAREGRLEFSKAIDTHTGKPLSLGPLLELKEHLTRIEVDPSPHFVQILAGLTLEDLQYSFSRLPEHSAKARAAEYARYLSTPIRQVQPIAQTPVAPMQTGPTPVGTAQSRAAPDSATWNDTSMNGNSQVRLKWKNRLATIFKSKI